jgi:hypothetical protein
MKLDYDRAESAYKIGKCNALKLKLTETAFMTTACDYSVMGEVLDYHIAASDMLQVLSLLRPPPTFQAPTDHCHNQNRMFILCACYPQCSLNEPIMRWPCLYVRPSTRFRTHFG